MAFQVVTDSGHFMLLKFQKISYCHQMTFKWPESLHSKGTETEREGMAIVPSQRFRTYTVLGLETCKTQFH